MKYTTFSFLAAVLSGSADAVEGRKGLRRLSDIDMSLPMEELASFIENGSSGGGSDGEITSVFDNPVVKDIIAKREQAQQNGDLDVPPEGITGGEPLPQGDRPYLVSFGYYPTGGYYYDDTTEDPPYFHFCAGSLIAPRVVLYAAACSFGLDGAYVNLNRYYIDDDTGVISYPLCGVDGGSGCDLTTYAYSVRHPLYDGVTNSNDFALVVLPEEVDSIEPVMLNQDTETPMNDDALDVFGWGSTEFGTPNVPYTATVKYIPNDQCVAEPNLYETEQITPDMLCAADADKGPCNGDVGDPIVKDLPNGKTIQVGIASWGEDCANPEYPGVYARITAGNDWINNTVCGEIGEWCSDQDTDGDYCFEVEGADPDHTVMDTGDALLPGFIQEMIDSGVIAAKHVTNSNSKPPKPPKNMGLADGPVVGIVGGDESEKKTQPYLVSIGSKSVEPFRPGGYLCAGTLIEPNVVLSAAHCFTDQYGSKSAIDFWVELNRYDLSSDPGVVRVYLRKDDIWRHQHFNYMTRENDLALLFLPVGFDNIEPVMLNGHPDIPGYPGAPMDVSGWGRTSKTGYYPDRPRMATVEYVPNADCTKPGVEISPDMICATAQETVGPCTGDSGGPLVVETEDGHHLQVGVTSMDVCVPKPPKPIVIPPCPSGTKILTVELMTDDYPSETAWTLMNLCGGDLQINVGPGAKYEESNTLYTDDYCVPDNEFEFTIYDVFGDGICCEYGEGYYKVTYDGTEVASGGDFEASESTMFGNPNGECVIDAGVYARVSSGMEWIERAMECRSSGSPGGGKSSKSRKSSKSGKSGKGSKSANAISQEALV